ncbi:MAG: NUDIX domain-containing protein [Variovorax sp.]
MQDKMLALTRQELDAYLVRHPTEKTRLRALARQLRDDRDVFARSNMAGHITSSVLVLDATRSNVLLIHHKVYDMWMQPGGHVEADSASLIESGLREVQEETGLAGAATQPLLDGGALDVDTHAIAARPVKGETDHRHHDFLYVAIAHHQFELKPQLDEVNGVGWVRIEDFLAIPGQRMAFVAPKLRRLLADLAQPAAPSTSTALVPPKAKEFDSIVRTAIGRATPGT